MCETNLKVGHLIRWQGARLRYKAQNKKALTTPTRLRKIETNFNTAIRRLYQRIQNRQWSGVRIRQIFKRILIDWSTKILIRFRLLISKNVNFFYNCKFRIRCNIGRIAVIVSKSLSQLNSILNHQIHYS